MYASASARKDNAEAFTRELEAIFVTRSLDEWRSQLSSLDAPWAPQQSVRELHTDPQVVANGYLTEVHGHDGESYKLVGNSCQFDEVTPALTPAPECGAHTEEVLLELGLEWDEITNLRTDGVL